MAVKKLKELYKSDKFPFIIYMIVIAISTMLMQKTGADDIFFSNVCNDRSLWAFLVDEYQHWTSRVVITGVVVVFCQFLPMIVWKLANIGMYYLLIYSISKLIVVKNQRRMNYILAIVLLCIPIAILAEAGWIATMNNYLWVAATGLYTMIPLKKLVNNEKVSGMQMVTSVIAIIYAANQEQMAGILAIVYACYTFIFIKKYKKIKPFIVIMDIIIVLSLLITLTCPGNMIRKVQEEETSFQGYSELSLLNKLEIGLTSMMDYAVLDERLIFYIFLILMAVALWRKSKNKLVKILAIVPIGIQVAFKYANKFFAEVDSINVIETQMYAIFKAFTYIAILVLAGICLYMIFKKNGKSWLVIMVYVAGVISRFVMAFSPTVYASQERTSLFLYISICILIVQLSNELSESTTASTTK